jgi:threonine aldolase
MLRTLEGEGGVFTPEQLDAAVRPPGDRYAPRSRLVSVEQTTDVGGGRMWPIETIGAVLEVARAHGSRAHRPWTRIACGQLPTSTSPRPI